MKIYILNQNLKNKRLLIYTDKKLDSSFVHMGYNI